MRIARKLMEKDGQRWYVPFEIMGASGLVPYLFEISRQSAD